MVYDELLSMAEDKSLGTAITGTAVDLGQEKPGLGALKPPFYALLFTKDAAGAGSVTFKIQDSDDNSTFTDAVSFTLTAGKIPANMAIPLPLQHKRYVRLATTVTATDSNTVAGTLVKAVLHNEFELVRNIKAVGYDILATID
nr:MAG TPA: major capsid protein [Caudoviricetes sp.]